MDVPAILYSPELIFSGIVPLFSIDFFKNPGTGSGKVTMKLAGVEISGIDSGLILHDVVQNWYKTLRIASVIALLSILIYAGIKILLSVSAEQTAKYKEFLKDWVIALIMVAGIHYFMVFVIEASNSLMEMLNTANSYNIVVFRPGFDDNKNVQDVLEFPLADGVTTKEGLDYTPMPIASGTFIGEARFFAGEGDWAYLLIYLVLTIYSIMFSWIYLKRVIYLAFLTIVAPLVAFSYPLDKMGDGSAQAFKFWIREYTFNVFVQPLHLFIYLVIVTAAQDLADTNPIYALVAIGSIFAFEKVVRQMLGFNKTQSAPTLTGGAAVLTLGNTLLNRAKSAANSGNNNNKEEAKVRTDRKVDSENKNRDPYSQGSINGKSNNSVRANSNNSNNEDDNENGNVQERLEQGDDGQREPIGGAEESGETNDEANQSNNSDNGGSDGNHDEVDVNVENENDNNNDNEKKKDTLRVGTLIVDNIQANTSTVGSTNLGGPNGGDPNGGGPNGGDPNGGGPNGGGPNGGDPDDGNPDDEEPNDYEDEFDEFFDNDPANNANPAMSDFAARKKALKNQVKSNKKQARKMKRRQQSERTSKQIVGFAKKAGKFAGKLPMAALLATYGAAIGIASGDASKVAGLTAAGAAGGAALGGAINNKIGDSVKELQKNREEDKEAYEKALYGESYSDLKNIEADKAFMKDKEIDKKYRDEFEQEQGESVRHYDKRIKEIKQHALDYRSHGITDNDTIIQAIKLEEEARSGAITDAAERANYLSDNMYDIAKFAQQCPTNEEGILAFEERLVKGYQSAFEKNNMDREEAKQRAEENAAAIIQAIRRMRG